MRFTDALARLVTHRGRAILLGASALLALSLWPLAHVKFGTDIFELIPQNTPSLLAFRDFSKHFAQGNDLILAIEPRAGASESQTDAFVEALTADLEKIPNVRDVQFRLDEVDAAAWRSLLPQTTLWLTAEDWDEAQRRLQPEAIAQQVRRLRVGLEAAPSPAVAERLTADPLRIFELGARRFQNQWAGSESAAPPSPFRSADGALRLLYVEAKGDVRDSRFCMGLLDQTSAAVAGTRDTGKFRVRYTGSVAFAAEIAAKMRFNMIAQALSSMAAVILIFWIGFRRLYPLLCIALTLALVIVVTLACGQAFFSGLNLITVSFAAILIGLGVDYGIVIYERLAEAQWRGGTAEAAARDVAEAVGTGILMGAATTTAAFLAVAMSHAPAFRQLGFIVCFGIGICAAAMLTLFLYLQLLWLPPRASGATQKTARGKTRASAPVIVAVAAALLLVALTVLLTGAPRGVGFDSDPNSLRFRHSEAQATLDLVSTKMGRHNHPLEVLVGGRDWVEAAQRLRALDTRLANAQKAGSVVAYESAARFLPPSSGGPAPIDFRAASAAFERALAEQRLSREAFRTTWDWLDETKNSGGAVTQARLTRALEAMPSLRPFARRFVNFSDDRCLLVAYVYLREPLRRVEDLRRCERELDAEGRVTGWDALIVETLPMLRKDFQKISALVLMGVAAMLLAYYRRVTVVTLALTPLMLSIVCLLAVMKLVGLSFNLANIFCVPILLGTGIDYSIYVMNAWRQSDGDVDTALRQTRKAVVMAAATTMVGFGSMMISNHAGMQQFGLLTALGIFLCALNALVVLPALLRWLRIRPQ